MPSVLVVSDNIVFKEDLIGQINYNVSEFKVCSKIEDNPDIIVIDGVCRDELLKDKINTIPVIWLKDKDGNVDCQGGQVIVKPFVLEEFLDALKSADTLFANSQEGGMDFSNYILHPLQKEITEKTSGCVCKLTEKEVAIIKYLYKNRNNYVSKQDLLKEVWGYADDATTHTVETHIYRLRQKVEKNGLQIIETTEGGYHLL